jgi:hypothetical protein
MFLARFVKDIEFEVLTAVPMKSSVFWDITPCSPLKVNTPPPFSASKNKPNINPARKQSSA